MYNFTVLMLILHFCKSSFHMQTGFSNKRYSISTSILHALELTEAALLLSKPGRQNY